MRAISGSLAPDQPVRVALRQTPPAEQRHPPPPRNTQYIGTISTRCSPNCTLISMKCGLNDKTPAQLGASQ